MLQRRHHRAFLVGGDAAEDGSLLHHLFERLSFWRVARVDCRGGAGNARLVGDRLDRCGIVARDDLQGDTLLGEVSERFGSVRTHMLPQEDKPYRHESAREAVVGYCRQFLHKHVPPSQYHGRHREGDACQKNQPLRNHSHQSGHRVGHAIGHADSGARLAPDEQRSHRHDAQANDLQEAVDAILQVGTHARVAPPLARYALREGLGTHSGDPEEARPRHNEAPRQHAGALALQDRHRLSGQERLVDLQAFGLEHVTVGRNLIPGRQAYNLVNHYLSDADILFRPVTDNPRCGRGEQRESIERDLCPELLSDSDNGVDHYDRPEKTISPRTKRDHADEENPEDQVEPGEDVGTNNVPRRTTGAVG